MAKEHLYWHRPYSTVMAGSFAAGDVQWFPEGGLNVSYNCVDRWAYKHPKKVRTHSYLILHSYQTLKRSLKLILIPFSTLFLDDDDFPFLLKFF